MLSDRLILFLPAAGRHVAPEMRQQLDRLGYTVFSDVPLIAGRSRVGSFGGFVFDLLPGAIASPVTRDVAARGGTAAELERGIAAQCQLYHLVESDAASCTLRSDPLGLKPLYIAELPEGWLLASSIRDLLAIRPELAAPIDPPGILAFLTFGAPLRDRTLHARIRRSRCGEVFRWTAQTGPSSTDERRVLPGAIRGERGYALTVREVLDTLGDSLRTVSSSEQLGWLMPLTGGFDSRLLACTASAFEMRPSLRTLGQPHHAEVSVARLVADALGFSHEVQEPRRDILDMLDLWLAVTEGQLDSHTVFISHLLQSGHPEGGLVTHGFLGDALAGSHVNWLTDEEMTSREAVADGLMRYFTSHYASDLGNRLGLSACLENLKQDCAAGLPAEGAPYQAFVVWDMENRQRRFVGPQLLYLGTKFRAVAPNYDRRLMDLWLAMPKMALEHRTLLRRIFRERFPRVAPIPHCEEKPVEIPRTLGLARYTAGVLGRSIADRVRTRLAGRQRFVTRRDNYIWNVWHGATEQQHRRLEQELRDRASSDLLPGWRIPEPTPAWLGTLSPNPHRQSLLLRRMVLMARWAESVRTA